MHSQSVVGNSLSLSLSLFLVSNTPHYARSQGLHFCFDNSSNAVLISQFIKDEILLTLEPEIELWMDPNGMNYSGGIIKWDKILCLIYVVNDVIFNSQVEGVKNVWVYRTEIDKWVDEVFEGIGKKLVEANEIVKRRVGNELRRVVDGWERWGVWEEGRGGGLRRGIEGREKAKLVEEDIDGEEISGEEDEEKNIDGAPLSDNEDIDGEPMSDEDEDEDIDGEPMSD